MEKKTAIRFLTIHFAFALLTTIYLLTDREWPYNIHLFYTAGYLSLAWYIYWIWSLARRRIITYVFIGMLALCFVLSVICGLPEEPGGMKYRDHLRS